jgi:hypothetical protein
VQRDGLDRGPDLLVWQLAVLLMPFFEQNMFWNEWAASHDYGLVAARRSLTELHQGRILAGFAALHQHTAHCPEAVVYCDAGLDV